MKTPRQDKSTRLGERNKEKLFSLKFPVTIRQHDWVKNNIPEDQRKEFLYKYTRLNEYYPKHKCLDPLFTILYLKEHLCDGCSIQIEKTMGGKSMCKSCYSKWRSNLPEVKARMKATCIVRYGGMARGSEIIRKKIDGSIQKRFGPKGYASEGFTSLRNKKVYEKHRAFGLAIPGAKEKAAETFKKHNEDPHWVEEVRTRRKEAWAKRKSDPISMDRMKQSGRRQSLRYKNDKVYRENRYAKFVRGMERSLGKEWRAKAMERLRKSRYTYYRVTYKNHNWTCQGYERFIIPELLARGINPRDLVVERESFLYERVDGRLAEYYPDIFVANLVVEVKSVFTAGLFSEDDGIWKTIQLKSRAVAEDGFNLTLCIVNEKKGFTIIKNPHKVTRKRAQKLSLKTQLFTWEDRVGSDITITSFRPD